MLSHSQTNIISEVIRKVTEENSASVRSWVQCRGVITYLKKVPVSKNGTEGTFVHNMLVQNYIVKVYGQIIQFLSSET